MAQQNCSSLEKFLEQANRDARKADRRQAGPRPGSAPPRETGEKTAPTRRRIDYSRTPAREDPSDVSTTDEEPEILCDTKVPAPTGKRPRRDDSSQHQAQRKDEEERRAAGALDGGNQPTGEPEEADAMRVLVLAINTLAKDVRSEQGPTLLGTQAEEALRKLQRASTGACTTTRAWKALPAPPGVKMTIREQWSLSEEEERARLETMVLQTRRLVAAAIQLLQDFVHILDQQPSLKSDPEAFAGVDDAALVVMTTNASSALEFIYRLEQLEMPVHLTTLMGWKVFAYSRPALVGKVARLLTPDALYKRFGESIKEEFRSSLSSVQAQGWPLLRWALYPEKLRMLLAYFSNRDLMDEEGTKLHRLNCPPYKLDTATDAVREYRTQHRVIINNHRQKNGPPKQKKQQQASGANKENATGRNLPKLSDYLRDEKKRSKTREKANQAETSCRQEARLRR